MEPEDSPGAEPTGNRVCPHCGQTVPPLPFCVRCGSAFDRAVRRHEYAAHPGEPARALRLFSTLFPHLPQATLRLVPACLRPRRRGRRGAGHRRLLSGRPGRCGAPGAGPVRPVFHRGRPVRTGARRESSRRRWPGAPWSGSILGGAIRLIGGTGLADSSSDIVAAVPGAVGVALLGAALATIGPLSLIRHRAFNDVLDGATFGAISGAAFASTFGLVRAGRPADGRPPARAAIPLPWLDPAGDAGRGPADPRSRP